MDTDHPSVTTSLDATLASLDAMLIRSKGMPSIPDLAAQIKALQAVIATLTQRLDMVEQECMALRQREVLRFWTEDEEP